MCRFVLDLGASPGSWLQVTSSKLNKSNPKIMGVDRKKIKPVEGVKHLHMDVYSDLIGRGNTILLHKRNRSSSQ